MALAGTNVAIEINPLRNFSLHSLGMVIINPSIQIPKVAIWGLGHIGVVSFACLKHLNVDVVGIDIDPIKVSLIKKSMPPFKEPKIVEMLRDGGPNNAVTVECSEGIEADISMVCVGTPPADDGKADITALLSVCKQIGENIKHQTSHHLVVIRSTIFGGTTENFLIPVLEEVSKKKVGKDFDIVVFPEFLREGSAVEDYFNPPFMLYGATSPVVAQKLDTLYKDINVNRLIVSFEVAETAKPLLNIFKAMKVAFANEVGRLCRGIHIDPNDVLQVIHNDTKLSISSHYLHSGMPFGGSCFSKDTLSVITEGSELSLALPLMNSILESNTCHVNYILDLLLNSKPSSVLILGLSFKASTDDLRESQPLLIAHKLIQSSVKVFFYDPDVDLNSLDNFNKDYLSSLIPNAHDLFVDEWETIQNIDITLITKKHPSFDSVIAKLDPNNIIDLSVRLD